MGDRRVDSETVLYMPFTNVIGPDGLLTTVTDLLTWNQALDSGALRSFVIIELQREADDNAGHALGYARGLWVGSRNGQREVSHGGQTGTSEATLLRYPDWRLSVAVLCNGWEITSSGFGKRLADLYLPPARPTPTPLLAARKAADRQRYAGTFINGARSQVAAVTYSSAGLTWRGGALQAIGATWFMLSDEETIVSKRLIW